MDLGTEALILFVLIAFWVAPVVTCWKLAENDGKDPLGPILGAIFFSWAGGLIIWALIKPDPDRIKERDYWEQQKDADFLIEKKKRAEISPQRRAELEKLLIAPKTKTKTKN